MKNLLLKFALFTLVMAAVFACSSEENPKISSNIFESNEIGIYDAENKFIRISEGAMSEHWITVLDRERRALNLTNYSISEEIDEETSDKYSVLRAESSDGKTHVATILQRDGSKYIYNQYSCACISEDGACDVKVYKGDDGVMNGCSCISANENNDCTKTTFATLEGWEDFK